jgi:fructose-specific phosphotransferase system IIC component
MKQPIDWIRAVFFGAISGGFLWAIMVRMLSIITHEHMRTHALYTFFASISLCILAIGIILYLRAKTSFWRSTAVGIILAPLTEWSVLLLVSLTVVLPSHRIH